MFLFRFPLQIQICYVEDAKYISETRNSLISQLDTISLLKRQFRLEAGERLAVFLSFPPKVKCKAKTCHSGLAEY